MEALETLVSREDLVGLAKKYIAGIGLSMVPIYLVADENSILEPERLLATGIASIIVPLFKLHELYFLYVLKPIYGILAKHIGKKVEVSAGQSGTKTVSVLPADYALVATLLVNGVLTAVSARIMEEEGLATKILGALGGIIAATTSWKVVGFTLDKEFSELTQGYVAEDLFPMK